MGKKKLKKLKEEHRKANTSHIAHQIGVTGVGPHKDKSKEIPRNSKHKIEEEW